MGGKKEFKGYTGKCYVCGIKVENRKQFCESCIKQRQLRLRDKYRDRIRKYYKEWYKRNGRNRNPNYIEIIKKWQLDNIEAVKCRGIVDYAVKKGKIRKPKKCERCHNVHNHLHAHHPNYNQPFNILWLCPSCHKLIHIELDKQIL